MATIPDTVETSPLAQEFASFLDRELDPFFGLSGALSDLDCEPFGNLGTLVPVVTFLSLCGLPLPRAFSRWEVSYTAYAPFLRGELSFFVEAQSLYVRAIVRSTERRLLAGHALLAGGFKPRHKKSRPNGLKDIWLESSEGKPWPVVCWHGRPISHVSTLDEWMRVTQGFVPVIQPGAQMTRINPVDPQLRPFYALVVTKVEFGERKGDFVCRQCARPSHVPCLAHYDLTPDHPLALWLSGYETVPDQVVRAEEIAGAPEPVGDWASLPARDAFRELIVTHLRRCVTDNSTS